MTKKDYELFAYGINFKLNNGMEKRYVDQLVMLCTDTFKADNQAFQPEKFRRACYEGKHIRKSISGKV